MKRLQDAGISTRPGTHAVHMLNFYKNLYGIKADDFPNAKHANDFSMAIPLHNRMTGEDYEYVVNIIKSL
jgi:dTDP-4-amino-4,6-dideoxygalactose transaminase